MICSYNSLYTYNTVANSKFHYILTFTDPYLETHPLKHHEE